MAFVPNIEMTCTLYYVGFPKTWKERLVKIERMLKPKWNGVYALPTYALKNSLGAWMDGIIELTPLRMESNDEMWAISCEQEINTKLLFEHIIIWLHSYYLSNSKVSPIAKSEIQSLIHSMNVEELNALAGSKTVRLFDSNGIPTESYSYAAFSLMVTNALVGKSIMIDGHEVVLNYAGKNQLVSDLQGNGNNVYSYGVSFSLQTVPPERKSLLLCDCCIHRWIPGKWKDKPYFNKDNIVAHIWTENHRIYKLPILQKYKTEEEYFWQETEEKYYNLYNYGSLPSAREVIDSLDKYLEGNQKITCLYKNGMDGLGFATQSTLFMSLCKQLKESIDNIRYVLCGADELVKLMINRDPVMTMYNDKTRAISQFTERDKKDYHDMLCDPMVWGDSGHPFVTEALDYIFTYTGGNAMYGKLICDAR